MNETEFWETRRYWQKMCEARRNFRRFKNPKWRTAYYLWGNKVLRRYPGSFSLHQLSKVS